MTDTNASTMTAKEIAEELDADAKTVRRFLRSVLPADARPGKGGRYAIDANALEVLRDRFADYRANRGHVITVDDLTTIGDDTDEVDDDEA